MACRSNRDWFTLFSRASAACMASRPLPHSSRSGFWKINKRILIILDPLDYWLSRTFFQKQKPFLWCTVNEPWCPGGRCDHHGCSGASSASRHVHAPRRTTPWRTLKILSELRHHDRSKTPEIFTNMINIQCIVMFLLNLTCFSHVIQTSCII